MYKLKNDELPQPDPDVMQHGGHVGLDQLGCHVGHDSWESVLPPPYEESGTAVVTTKMPKKKGRKALRIKVSKGKLKLGKTAKTEVAQNSKPILTRNAVSFPNQWPSVEGERAEGAGVHGLVRASTTTTLLAVPLTGEAGVTASRGSRNGSRNGSRHSSQQSSLDGEVLVEEEEDEEGQEEGQKEEEGDEKDWEDDADENGDDNVGGNRHEDPGRVAKDTDAAGRAEESGNVITQNDKTLSQHRKLQREKRLPSSESSTECTTAPEAPERGGVLPVCPPPDPPPRAKRRWSTPASVTVTLPVVKANPGVPETVQARGTSLRTAHDGFGTPLMRRPSDRQDARPRGDVANTRSMDDGWPDKKTKYSSRNVRTAPSTPEAEMRTPPRHAESASQLELGAGSGKRGSGVGAHYKGLESYPEGTKSIHKVASSPKMNKSRNEKFHKLFKNVPDDEIVLKSYSCAYVSDILLQGYLYISTNWFCFHSKILSHEKQIEIPVRHVLNITREKTAFFIPNAIGIVTSRDKYVFGSLMQRDNTYKLMCNSWKKLKSGGLPVDVDREQLDSDMSDNDYAVADDGSATSLTRPTIQLGGSCLDSSEESDDVSVCSECGTPKAEHEPGGECDNLPNSGDTSISHSVTSAMTLHVDAHGEKALLATSTPSLLQSSSGGVNAAPPGRVTSSSAADGSHGRRGPTSQLPHHGKSFRQAESSSWHGLNLRSLFSFISKLVLRIYSMQRTNLLLLICSVLVVFLLLSATVMTYKIVLLQAQLESGSFWGDTPGDKYVNSDKMYSDIYYLNSRFHTSTIERFHSVLEANIQLLGQVHDSLQSLQKSAVLSDSYAESASAACSDLSQGDVDPT